ncbi:hypothetical protein GGQ79_003825 [Ochrobactrum pecoris]|uniref:Uncharacterized protein n=1 Tax=Brucella pecoris TaxID=867683 RepID=A0A5C5CGG6_9HYPH|nr:hypothetical protein [Brucella pecoris]TNV10502.1 hypothetical protein FIB18_16150 [Brucella pecoris]
MRKEHNSNSAQQKNTMRPRHDEDRAASKSDLTSARQQMTSPSKDWTKLANILRRACGGFSRSRSPRHVLPRSKRNGQ